MADDVDGYQHCDHYTRCSYRDPDRPGECRCTCEKCIYASSWAEGRNSIRSALAARDAEIAKLRALLREVRMYALGNDVSTQLLMERVDAALAERGE